MGQADFELMRRVQRRDAAAFEAFVRRHDRTLRLHLRRYVGPDDAGDLRQEVLLRLWDRAHQWEGRGSPLAWLLRIATNIALNHLRARRPTVPLEGASDEEGDPSDAGPVPELAQSLRRDEFEPYEQAAHLMELMQQMPEEKRSVLTLARLENLKLQEIADQLDVPLGTVKSRLHAATEWLEARWEEDE